MCRPGHAEHHFLADILHRAGVVHLALREPDLGLAWRTAEHLVPSAGESVLDAGHRTVIPGLHDHHVHLYSAAAALTSVPVGPREVHGRNDLARVLAEAVIGFARSRGARALEAYPMITQVGKTITWGELHVGARQVFEDAEFKEVSHPTLRRVVMRIDFAD